MTILRKTLRRRLRSVVRRSSKAGAEKEKEEAENTKIRHITLNTDKTTKGLPYVNIAAGNTDVEGYEEPKADDKPAGNTGSVYKETIGDKITKAGEKILVVTQSKWQKKIEERKAVMMSGRKS